MPIRFPSVDTAGALTGDTRAWVESLAGAARDAAQTYANDIRWDDPKNRSGPANDLDTLLTPKTYSIAGTTPNTPVAGHIGSLMVWKLANAVCQLFVDWTDGYVYFRTFNTNGTPKTAWQQLVRAADLDALKARLGALESGVKPTGRAGMKTVPLTMTAPGTPESIPDTVGGAVRWSRRYAVMPKRVRVHLANVNTGNGLVGNKDLNLAQVRVGAGGPNGEYTQGVAAPLPTPTKLTMDGAELITPWITVPGLTDGGYLTVTVSWWGGGGNTVLQVNQGGGWTTTDNTKVTQADTVGWTRTQTTPLHCWVEAEVPASTPVLCAHGDSITIGTATTDPVGDSWASKYAYAQGALPVILAMHGSSMTNWTPGAIRWAQFGKFDLRSVVDATVTTLGQNDLTVAGMDVETLKARHATMLEGLRAVVGGPIYLGSITPSNKAAAVEAVRRDFNTWRSTLPAGERGVFSFAAAVGDTANEDLLPEYSADGLHPNAAGQQKMADEVLKAPVTPYVLPPAKLKSLSA